MADQTNQQQRAKVAVVGGFQNGKSTLVNCLLNGRVAHTGEGIATTRHIVTYTWGEVDEAVLRRPDGTHETLSVAGFIAKAANDPLDGYQSVEVRLWRPLLQRLDLLDTPGIDADDQDSTRAAAAIQEANFAIVLLANAGLTTAEQNLVRHIQGEGKPFVVVVNCNDPNKWDPKCQQNQGVVGEIAAQLPAGCKSESIQEQPVWLCNLMWFWYASGHLAQDGERYESQRMTAMVQEHFDGQVPAPHSLAQRSGLLDIRDRLSAVEGLMAPTGALCAGLLEVAVASWVGGINKAIAGRKG